MQAEPNVHRPAPQAACENLNDHPSHFWHDVPSFPWWCPGIDGQEMADAVAVRKIAELYNGAPMATGTDAADDGRALPDVELDDAEGEYMKMLDPQRPWLMLTSDGFAWIQCADCDTWIQVDGRPTLDEATRIAAVHRATNYPHVQPRPAAAQRPAKVRGLQWWGGKGRKRRQTGTQRLCAGCGIREVAGRCHNSGCARGR